MGVAVFETALKTAPKDKENYATVYETALKAAPKDKEN